jgi:hypothetical protein
MCEMTPALQTDIVLFTPSFHDLRIDRRIVEQDLGYRGTPAPGPVIEAIEEILPQVSDHVSMQSGYRILPSGSVMREKDTILAADTVFSTGAIIAHQLRDAVSLAVYVSSAGPGMERWAAELMASGELMKGYIVDAIASEAVEQASALLERQVVESVSSLGWKTTNRYSPGYCDWPVTDQSVLFSLLPGDFCGIKLTPSSLMIPIKSISGIIGLGPDVERGEFQCAICDLKDCFRRQADS